MFRVRRHDLAPRVELLPLIDVIFLLLTFFIYSLVMMVQAQVLPVALVPVGTAERAEPAQVEAITIDRAGRLYLNREPIAPEALDAALAELAERDPRPTLFLALEETSAESEDAPVVDRGPVLTRLIEQLRAAGLTDFTIVGPPEP